MIRDAWYQIIIARKNLQMTTVITIIMIEKWFYWSPMRIELSMHNDELGQDKYA